MKQQKLSGYQPNYPRRAVKGVALAAAALMALGTSAGCTHHRTQTTGIVPMEEPTPGIERTLSPEEVQLEGYVAPEPDDVRTGGVPMPEPTPEPEEIMLSGDVAIIDVP